MDLTTTPDFNPDFHDSLEYIGVQAHLGTLREGPRTVEIWVVGEGIWTHPTTGQVENEPPSAHGISLKDEKLEWEICNWFELRLAEGALYPWLPGDIAHTWEDALSHAREILQDESSWSR